MSDLTTTTKNSSNFPTSSNYRTGYFSFLEGLWMDFCHKDTCKLHLLIGEWDYLGMDCYYEIISEGSAEVTKHGGTARPSVQSSDLYALL